MRLFFTVLKPKAGKYYYYLLRLSKYEEDFASSKANFNLLAIRLFATPEGPNIKIFSPAKTEEKLNSYPLDALTIPHLVRLIFFPSFQKLRHHDVSLMNNYKFLAFWSELIFFSLFFACFCEFNND